MAQASSYSGYHKILNKLGFPTHKYSTFGKKNTFPYNGKFEKTAPVAYDYNPTAPAVGSTFNPQPVYDPSAFNLMQQSKVGVGDIYGSDLASNIVQNQVKSPVSQFQTVTNQFSGGTPTYSGDAPVSSWNLERPSFVNNLQTEGMKIDDVMQSQFEHPYNYTSEGLGGLWDSAGGLWDSVGGLWDSIGGFKGINSAIDTFSGIQGLLGKDPHSRYMQEAADLARQDQAMRQQAQNDYRQFRSDVKSAFA